MQGGVLSYLFSIFRLYKRIERLVQPTLVTHGLVSYLSQVLLVLVEVRHTGIVFDK